MKKTEAYLFVYGTLLQAGNEFAAYLAANADFYSKAKFKGFLYDLGPYPGVIADPGNGSFVNGNVFVLKNARKVLKVLDDYEGFGPEYPEPNLFIREYATVETGTGLLACWIYLYNLPVEGYARIKSGDYLEYKTNQ